MCAYVRVYTATATAASTTTATTSTLKKGDDSSLLLENFLTAVSMPVRSRFLLLPLSASLLPSSTLRGRRKEGRSFEFHSVSWKGMRKG